MCILGFLFKFTNLYFWYYTCFNIELATSFNDSDSLIAKSYKDQVFQTIIIRNKIKFVPF